MSMRIAPLVFALGLSLTAIAQNQAQAPTQNSAPAQNQDAASRYTVPAGTQVLMVLKSPISTKNAQPGSPVYAETSFPIAIDGRMLIPTGSYVQGVIDRVVRPGRVKGRAQVQIHFTTLIYPNGYTVVLPGSLSGAPGGENEKVAGKEGTVTENGSKGRDVGTVAATTGTGTLIGAGVGGAKGAGVGAGLGAAAGLASVLFTRGNDIRFDVGTPLEMTLQRPLVLEEQRIANLRPILQPVETNQVLQKPSKPGVYVSPSTVGDPYPLGIPNPR